MSDAENAPHPDSVGSNNGGTEPEPTVQSGDSFAGTSIDPNSIEGVFLLALQKEQPEERESYLDEVCGDDDDRRHRVKALLRAFDDAGSFLETPASGPRPQQEISLSFLQPIDKEGCLGTIGPYEVLEVIGRGGMGLVLRAVDLKLNRIVAVKVLLPELAANPNARRRFLREAQAAAAVSHPHVITIHAVEEAQGDGTEKPVPPYLVMECVVGQSLQEKLDSVGSLRLAETLRISRQIGEGLADAHKQGLIHRDIKPANILLENGVERVKITDFGLARAIDDITVTRTGEVSGTPQYMSPEQASGERVDHRSDLFSLGCVMYAMCTGHSPFRGDSLAHVIKRVTQDTPRPIAEQNAEVPPWLVQIIDCLLQKNPDHRFQSAEGLVVILEQHLARIQQPTDSGSHSVINKQMGVEPATAAASGKTAVAAVPMAERLPSDAPSTQSFTSHRAGTYLVALGALIIFGLAASMLLVATNIVDASSHVRNASDAILGISMGIATICLVAGMLLRNEILGHETWKKVFQLAGCTLLGPIGIGWWLKRESSPAEQNGVARTPSASPPSATVGPQNESRVEHYSSPVPAPPRAAPAATQSVSEEGIAWDTDPPEVEVPNSFRIGGVALVMFGLIVPVASFLQGLFDVPGPLGLVVVCFGCVWPITTGLCLRRRHMTRDGLLMIAFLALGPVGLLMYFFQKDQLRPAEIDHVGRRRKRERRDKWGVGLQGVGASIVFFGLIGLVLLMLDVLVFGKRNTPPTIAAVLGVGALVLIVGTMLRENTDDQRTMLLPLYFLLGPFGLVLWLVEWDSRRRRQPTGGTPHRFPGPVSRATDSSQVSAIPAVPAVPPPPPENAFTSREPEPSAVLSSTHTEPHAASPSPQQKRSDATPQTELAESQNSSESTHGRTGRWLVSLGLFLVVLPVATVACGFFVDGDVMEFGSLLGMVAVPVGLLAIIVGYVLRYIIDKEQQHHRPLQPGLPIIMATVLAAIGAAVHGFVEQSAESHGSEAVLRSESDSASERDRRSLQKQLNSAVIPSQSARPDERGGQPETVVMSVHPAKGERAGTLNVAIHDDGMRVVLRRKSAFGGYVSGSEQQVTKVGDSSLRLHPGDYEVGIQDRNFGWADQYRVQDVAIVDGISEDIDVFRDVLQLEPVLGETTFYWNRELGAKTKTNGQIHAINRLVEAMNRDEHEVHENELIPHVKQQIIRGFPGGGKKIAIEIHTFADIFSPLPACIVPGKQNNTFRLAPIQQATLRIALVDDGLHMRLTANDNDAGVSPRTLDGRFGRNEAEYRLPPGQYQFVVSDTLANWEKRTGSGFVQSTNLTKRTINLDLKNEQLEEIAIKRDLEGLAEYDIDGLQLNDAESLAFSWGRSGGFGSSHSLELNQIQARCVQRLLKAMLEGNAEVEESELREITGQPTGELFPGIATDAIYSGDEDFRYRKLIVPGNSENTWRLLRLGNDE